MIFLESHKLGNGNAIRVICNVRIGGNRNEELTEYLRIKIRDGVADSKDIAPERVSTALLGFPASWAMEGGEILPEPGEEETWLKRKQHRSVRLMAVICQPAPRKAYSNSGTSLALAKGSRDDS